MLMSKVQEIDPILRGIWNVVCHATDGVRLGFFQESHQRKVIDTLSADTCIEDTISTYLVSHSITD